MTQFVRLSDPSGRTSLIDLCGVQEKIDEISCRPAEDGAVWIVSRRDPSSAGPLVDDLFNRLWNGEDVDTEPLVRLIRVVSDRGWWVEFWYSNDSEDLPTVDRLSEALAELLRQASLQPPEIYLIFAPARC